MSGRLFHIAVTILLIILLMGAVSCRKEETIPKPLIDASVSPKLGNTTQVFRFDLSKSDSRTMKGSKLFCRWDWDGDGNWDTPFTRILVYEHRYYAPGTWIPKVELSNLLGGTDTMSFTLPVIRGYSPPKPVLRLSQKIGHIFTNFIFDASFTRDDEDSLNQLKFRWDFENDGVWETTFGDSAKIHHRYPEIGYYETRLQVRDPSGLISTQIAAVNVSLEDPKLVATFRCIPDSVTDNTEITMDASASIDQDFPDKPLQYRWDWDNDRVYDTGWLNDPRTIHVFKTEFLHFVRLQVRSDRGLMNDTVTLMRVFHRNKPPRASFAVSTLTGNLGTDFRFDCWSTRDNESSPSECTYRWDFNGDGTWDTDYIGDVVTMYRFKSTGVFRALLQVRDPLGETDTLSRVIHVSNGTNLTGLYSDNRGDPPQTYGTVLIGDQWWFTRNMCLHDTSAVKQFYYNNQWEPYFIYGNLYLKGYVGGLCPPGWRVPTKDDWEKLFSNYPEDRLYEALMPGGESDFGAILGGMGIGTRIEEAVYSGLDKQGYYWTTSKPMGGESNSTWVITFDKPSGKVLKGFTVETARLYSARCVKDAN